MLFSLESGVRTSSGNDCCTTAQYDDDEHDEHDHDVDDVETVIFLRAARGESYHDIAVTSAKYEREKKRKRNNSSQ